MGYDIFTSIMAPIYPNQADIREIAAKNLSKLNEDDLDDLPDKRAMIFLQDVSEGKCVYCASKGEGLSWAAVGNGGSISDFVETLMPFLIDLWNSKVLPAYFGCVCTSNGESEGITNVAEIRIERDFQSKIRFGKTVSTEDIRIRYSKHDWYCYFDK